MASQILNVFSNGGEDLVDELASAIVYEEGDKYFKNVKEYLGLTGDTIVDEALESALSTIKFGLMNVVIITVTEYAIVKTGVVLMGIFTYIKTRRIIKQSVEALTKLPIIKNTPIGYAGGEIVKKTSDVLLANQTENLALAKMLNSSSNNIVSSIGQERQNQIMLQGQKIKRVESAKRNIYSTRNTSRNKNMDLFLHKFDTATWKDTAKDKKLYFDITGQDDKVVPFNAEFIKRINSYANIVTTAKGEIFNNAKATLDLITQMGARL
jgi:hypothetical protein